MIVRYCSSPLHPGKKQQQYIRIPSNDCKSNLNAIWEMRVCINTAAIINSNHICTQQHPRQCTSSHLTLNLTPIPSYLKLRSVPHILCKDYHNSRPVKSDPDLLNTCKIQGKHQQKLTANYRKSRLGVLRSTSNYTLIQLNRKLNSRLGTRSHHNFERLPERTTTRQKESSFEILLQPTTTSKWAIHRKSFKKESNATSNVTNGCRNQREFAGETHGEQY
ncbi:cysteine--tRNA ligase, cytoplasmic [Dorcoceras hygrometricum]|uniref:Cysteine--tRNA ligase, cytoplasmic n=1 Tax=Dorcoceras hygrometricum TaxID=472368 RepID=A0A2Z7CS85_9LAMI|nr:cysteine--tRNA ligase, cytoplasmic [Dorcoceras hygrometricum]